MEDVKVQLRYSVDKEPWSRYSRVDLTVGENHYFFPPVHEYFNSINLDIDILTKQKVSMIPIEGLKEFHPGKRYQLIITRDGGGRTGIRRIRLGFRTNRTTYFLKIILPLHPDNLQQEHFQAMLDDISHWIFFELAASVKLDVDYTNKYSQALRSQQVILDLIKKRMTEVEVILQQIALSPKHRIIKEYYRTTNPFERQDATTLRLANRNFDDSRTFAFHNISSYDVYENRFILFFFHQLERRLAFLQRVADRTIEDIEDKITQEKGWGNSIEIENLKHQKQEATHFSQECQELRSRLFILHGFKFLKDVNFTPNQFRFSYSLVLTQDFNYGRIFTFYQELTRQEEIKRLDRIRDFTEGLISLGVKATWQIYEYWVFFALYQVLLELHFYPQNQDDLLQIIKSDILTPGLESGKFVTLIADRQIYGDLTVLLYYEKSYKSRHGREVACPDITMEVRQGRDIKRFLFDAKYKTYTQQKGLGSKADFWETDFKTISTKYGPKGSIEQSEGAFLFHTNTQDLEFENYGAFVQKEEGGTWYANNHQYGFIPVVPGNSTSLKMLLAMIFLVKLEKRPRVCWLCGSTNIRWDGEPKSWRKCLNCENEWSENHCGICGFSPIYRGRFTFHFQHKDLQESSRCGYSICPKCGNCGKCKVSIDKILGEQ